MSCKSLKEFISFFFKGGSLKLKGNGEEETEVGTEDQRWTDLKLQSYPSDETLTSQNQNQLTGV